MQGTSMQLRNATIEPSRLEGTVRVPDDAYCTVIFAHGSGSSRFSPRNTYVAEQLSARGIATLLFDLLTETEARDRANVFDIPLLGQRVIEAVSWMRADPRAASLPLGLFGASTGAAAALVAAAGMPREIGAVVSRGGRPDLAEEALSRVNAPTLLIVGGSDHGVIELNERAAGAMPCETRVVLIPGATHLFEESGTMDQVIDHASGWFQSYLGRDARR